MIGPLIGMSHVFGKTVKSMLSDSVKMELLQKAPSLQAALSISESLGLKIANNCV